MIKQEKWGSEVFKFFTIFFFANCYMLSGSFIFVIFKRLTYFFKVNMQRNMFNITLFLNSTIRSETSQGRVVNTQDCI